MKKLLNEWRKYLNEQDYPPMAGSEREHPPMAGAAPVAPAQPAQKTKPAALSMPKGWPPLPAPRRIHPSVQKIIDSLEAKGYVHTDELPSADDFCSPEHKGKSSPPEFWLMCKAGRGLKVGDKLKGLHQGNTLTLTSANKSMWPGRIILVVQHPSDYFGGGRVDDDVNWTVEAHELNKGFVGFKDRSFGIILAILWETKAAVPPKAPAPVTQVDDMVGQKVVVAYKEDLGQGVMTCAKFGKAAKCFDNIEELAGFAQAKGYKVVDPPDVDLPKGHPLKQRF